jgi:hypothetical protein
LRYEVKPFFLRFFTYFLRSVRLSSRHRSLDGAVADGNVAAGARRKAFAAGRLSGREEARIAAVLNDAERVYAAFAAAKPF